MVFKHIIYASKEVTLFFPQWKYDIYVNVSGFQKIGEPNENQHKLSIN